jgi:hypothetical protein
VRRRARPPSWPASRWIGGRSRWDRCDFARVSLMVGSFAWFAAIYAEASGPPRQPQAAPGLSCGQRLAVRGGLALLIALNAWLVDRNLAERTGMEARLPRWLRLLRAVAAGIPVLGLYVLPAWSRWLAEPPAWWPRPRSGVALDLRRGAAAPRGAGLAARLGSLRRRASQSLAGLLGWALVCQVGPALVVMNVLAASSAHARARLPFLAATGSLRLLAATSAFVYARDEIRRLQLCGARARLLIATPALLLLPFPYSLAAIPAWGPLLSDDREQATLVHAAYVRRPRFSSLRGTLAGGGSPEAPAAARSGATLARVPDRVPELGRAEQHRRAFYRLKTLLLFFDAAALGWALARFGGLGPVLLRQPMALVIGAFLAPVAAGLLIEASGLIAGVTGMSRWPWLADLCRRHPYGRFLAVTQSTFVAGLLGGALLAAGEIRTFGLMLAAVATFDLLASFLFSIVASLADMPGSSTSVAIAWYLLFFVAVGAGAALSGGATAARPLLWALHWALALTPLWSLALALGLTGSLVHPASLRQIARGRLLPGTRMVPALLALTAALPLGGLAIPLWIHARQRWWPEHERRWGSLAV